jgi:hypothetical protein
VPGFHNSGRESTQFTCCNKQGGVQSGAFGEVLQQCVGRDPEDLAQRQELLVGTHCAFTLIVRGRHGNLQVCLQSLLAQELRSVRLGSGGS